MPLRRRESAAGADLLEPSAAASSGRVVPPAVRTAPPAAHGPRRLAPRPSWRTGGKGLPVSSVSRRAGSRAWPGDGRNRSPSGLNEAAITGRLAGVATAPRSLSASSVPPSRAVADPCRSSRWCRARTRPSGLRNISKTGRLVVPAGSGLRVAQRRPASGDAEPCRPLADETFIARPVNSRPTTFVPCEVLVGVMTVSAPGGELFRAGPRSVRARPRGPRPASARRSSPLHQAGSGPDPTRRCS